MAKRVPVPKATQDELLTLCARRCCLCFGLRAVLIAFFLPGRPTPTRALPSLDLQNDLAQPALGGPAAVDD